MKEDSDELVRYFAGLDLGQAGQFSALAVLEQHGTKGKHGFESDGSYSLRHLARFPPGTPYADIVTAVRQVFSDSAIKKGTLVIDQTAVGRSVYDLFRKEVSAGGVVAITITASNSVQRDERGGKLVPKKDLVGRLQLVLQGRKLKVAAALEHARTLLEELQHFQIKTVPLKADAEIEWRERPHDDLVLAVAIAVWQAEHHVPFGIRIVDTCPVEVPRWWRRW